MALECEIAGLFFLDGGVLNGCCVWDGCGHLWDKRPTFSILFYYTLREESVLLALVLHLWRWRYFMVLCHFRRGSREVEIQG